MSYVPKSEEQLIREGLMPDGNYDFEVVDTDDRPSSKGSTMFTLKLHVFDGDGNPRIITDYIALGSNFGERKLRHAADACGILSIYESGNLVAADFKNKTGKLSLKTQEGTKDYPNPSNKVSDYLKREKQPESVATGALPPLDDDSIPF